MHPRRLDWTDRLGEVPRDDWEAALAASRRPTPFSSPRFLLPWAEAFAASRDVRVGRLGTAGGRPAFIFLGRRADGRGWEFLGDAAVADALDAVIPAGGEGEFWDAFLASAKDLLADGPVSLHSLPEQSPALALLPGLCGRHGLRCRIEETDRAPFVPLPGTFGEFVQGLGRKERHELRRKMRRSEETLPGLSLRVSRTREDLPGDVASFVDLHRMSHPEKEAFMDDRMAGFFRRLAAEFQDAGALRLAVLSFRGGDAAAAFQFAWNGAYHLYNSGFDPRHREASPGVVLVARCIGEAIAEGMGEYDFLRGTERYKYDLGGRDRVVRRAVVERP